MDGNESISRKRGKIMKKKFNIQGFLLWLVISFFLAGTLTLAFPENRTLNLFISGLFGFFGCPYFSLEDIEEIEKDKE